MQMISRLNVLHSSMTKPKAKKRHAILTEVIRRHDHAYYVLAEPTISDQDYDRLYRELLDLEEAHPGLLTVDSPSQRVGGKPVSEFPEHRHAVPMMSLDNTYSQEEVREFVGRVQKLLPGEPLICDGIELPLKHRKKRLDLEARGLIKGAQVVYLGPGSKPGFSRLHVVGAESPQVSGVRNI